MHNCTKSLSKKEVMLSICVPIFNHADRFRLQLRSIKDFSLDHSLVEFVVVDDCSTDDIDDVIEAFRASGWCVNAVKQQHNTGRASALVRALTIAEGKFVMIMDGDDTFEPGGIEEILYAIQKLEQREQIGLRNLCGFVFGTSLQTARGMKLNLPPEGIRTNFLALRADYCIKGDLKEVVRREIITTAICNFFSEFRRVPTSLLWARISARHDILCVARPVVSKVYLQGGMTNSLKSLRRDNVPPLLELYKIIASSLVYRSRWYRMRAEINYHRFLALQQVSNRGYEKRTTMLGIPMVLGLVIGTLERLRIL